MCRRRASAAQLTVHATWSVCSPRFSVWYVPISPDGSPLRLLPQGQESTDARAWWTAGGAASVRVRGLQLQGAEEQGEHGARGGVSRVQPGEQLHAGGVLCGPVDGRRRGLPLRLATAAGHGRCVLPGAAGVLRPRPGRPLSGASGSSSTGESRRESGAWRKPYNVWLIGWGASRHRAACASCCAR